MKELLSRMVICLFGIGLVVLIVADFRWLLMASRDGPAPAAPVRQGWAVAVMRHRIHAGMLET